MARRPALARGEPYDAAPAAVERGSVSHGLLPGIQPAGTGQRFAGAGGDAILLRFQSPGADPIAWVEDTSEDHEWAPYHTHPWDELEYVLEGDMEFRVGDLRGSGGPGTLVTIPKGVPHTLRVVPGGRARFVMVTLGAPSATFLEEIGEVYAEGRTPERLVEVAGRHGLALAPE